MSPKVSVCIPTYNRSSYIGITIKSILAQTFLDYELIVVDNCSTDNTREVVESFNDCRLSYFKNDTNLGIVGNFNRCISLAKGEYICIFHSDDVYMPRILECEVSILDENPKVGIVFTNSSVIGEYGDLVIPKTYYYGESYINGGEDEFRSLILFNHICCPTAMVRRKCYERFCRFDEELTFCSDWDMWLKICLYWQVAYVNEVMIQYRVHNASGTSLMTQLNTASMDEYKMIKKLFSNLPSDKKHLCSLETMAIRQAANRSFERAFTAFLDNQVGLARRSIALTIAIDESMLKDIKVYILFLLTLGGKYAVLVGNMFYGWYKKYKKTFGSEKKQISSVAGTSY